MSLRHEGLVDQLTKGREKNDGRGGPIGLGGGEKQFSNVVPIYSADPQSDVLRV